jgi:hypothetical protein
VTETPSTPTGGSDLTALTDEERGTIRTAAIVAGVLVSRAESGFFDTFRESFAASKAVRQAPPEVQELLTTGGWPSMPPAGSPEELESSSLGMIRAAVAALRAKAPHLVDGYRATVLQSCRDVAAAADDTSATETSAIAKVEQALA